MIGQRSAAAHLRRQREQHPGRVSAGALVCEKHAMQRCSCMTVSAMEEPLEVGSIASLNSATSFWAVTNVDGPHRQNEKALLTEPGSYVAD